MNRLAQAVLLGRVGSDILPRCARSSVLAGAVCSRCATASCLRAGLTTLIRLRLILRAAFYAVCLAALDSPYQFFESGIVQRLICDQFLEPAVLMLQFLETIDRVAVCSAILLLPAVAGLHTHADLPCGFFGTLASRDSPCGFTQLLDDFLYCMSLAFHLSDDALRAPQTFILLRREIVRCADNADAARELLAFRGELENSWARSSASSWECIRRFKNRPLSANTTGTMTPMHDVRRYRH